MKKVFSMLLFVAASLAISCDDAVELADDLVDDLEDVVGDLLGNETEGLTEYAGQVAVSDSFSKDSSFYLNDEGDVISIVMKEIQFSAYMPSMDITLCDLPVSAGAFAVDTAQTVVVMYNTVIEGGYPITELSGSYDDTTLTLSFICTYSDTAYPISFSGTVVTE